jgi:thymidylate kinase
MRRPIYADRGRVVVVAGPDGAGKSSLCNALVADVLRGRSVLRLHHRPTLLPARGGSTTDSSRPHQSPPYPAVLCTAKALYLFADYTLGWAVRIRPWVRRGGWVVLERGWWDMVVDPIRYRLRPPARTVRLLGILAPAPDLTLVLEAPPEVLRGRKAELPAYELARQGRAWRHVFPAGTPHAFLDAARPAAEVVAGARDATARLGPLGGHT